MQSSEWQLWSPSRVCVWTILLFLIYIDDITEDLVPLPLIYADDTTMFEIVDQSAISAGCLNSDSNNYSEWAGKWIVTMNPVQFCKVVSSLHHNKRDHPPLFLNIKVIRH